MLKTKSARWLHLCKLRIFIFKINNVEASLKMYRISKKLLEQNSYTSPKDINSIIEKIHNDL